MYFKFGNYELNIDVERTRQFYSSAQLLTEGCTCDGCENFVKASEILPGSVLKWFHDLGVDIRKGAEIYANCFEKDGTQLLYGGFFHICGELIKGQSGWVTQEENPSHQIWNQSNTFSIGDGFDVSFQEEVDILDEEFPQPAIQMEIEFHIPWVLDKENKYK